MSNSNGLRLVVRVESWHYDDQSWALRENHIVELFHKEHLLAQGTVSDSVSTNYPTLLTPHAAAEKMLEELRTRLKWAEEQVAVMLKGKEPQRR